MVRSGRVCVQKRDWQQQIHNRKGRQSVLKKNRGSRRAWLRAIRSGLLFGAPMLAALLVGLSLLNPSAAVASTGINQELSFEGKVVTSSGQNIADGTYNMEFRVYTGCSNEPTSNTGCTPVWTEDWLNNNSEGVSFTSGTYEVNLGAICGFSTGTCESNSNTAVNWNSYPLYLSLQIGNTSNCSTNDPGSSAFTADCGGDGVMDPYVLLTSTPYSFNSGELGGLTAAQFGQLSATQTWTGSNTIQATSTTAFQVQNASGQGLLAVDTSGNNINLGATGTTALASTVNIATSTGASQTLHIADSSTETATLTLGSAHGASATTIQGGTGDLVLQTGSPGSGNSGSITIQSGNASAGTSGSVSIDTGASIGDSTYTLFGQSLTDRGVATADVNAYTLGAQFSVSQTVDLSSVWFYSGANAVNLPSKTVIYDADTGAQVSGTLDTSPDWSAAAGSGWVQNLNYNTGGSLAGVSLSPGTHYVVATFSPGGAYWYSDTGTQYYWTTGPGASGITNGPLSAPNSAGSLNGQALYNAGGTLTFPTTSTQGYDFGVDVGVTGANASSVSVGATNANQITIGNTSNTSNTSAVTLQAEGISNTLTGSSSAPADVIKTSTNSTTAFQVQNSSGANLLNVDTADSQIQLDQTTSFGYTQAGTAQSTGFDGTFLGQRFTTGNTATTATTASVYVGSSLAGAGHTSYQVAIYTNATTGCGGSTVLCPGAWVASSSVGALTASAWNTITLSASLSANTTYWLVYDTNTNVTGGTSPDNGVNYNSVSPYTYSPQESGSLTFGSGANSGFPSSLTVTNDYLGTANSMYVTVSGGGPSVSITNNGIVTTPITFQDADNTANAFQIQSNIGDSLFTANTSAGQIIIGSGATGESGSVLLVVDSGTSSSDPTEVNGAIYYNSNMGLFRCGQAGVWRDCVSSVQSWATSGVAGSGSFTSGTYTNYPGSNSSVSFTKAASGTKLLVHIDIDPFLSSSSNNAVVGIDVLIAGTDYVCGQGVYNSAVVNAHFDTSCSVIVTGIAAGSQTAQIQWAILSGGGTMNAGSAWGDISVQETD
jgi:hypothetical protein